MNKNHQIVRKITLTALMLVFNVIFNRLFMMASITALNKIGLADVFIVFTSIYCGPLYGAVVGGFGDLLGALIFPKGDINWFITLAKFISGALPGLLHLIFRKIKNKKVFQFLSYGLLGIICVLLTVFINVFPTIQIFDFTMKVELWAKILFPCLAFGLSILLFLTLHLIEKKFHFDTNYETWFIVIFYEISFPLIINSIIKSLYYNVDFIPIFAVQLLLFIIDIALIVLILNILERVKKNSRYS